MDDASTLPGLVPVIGGQLRYQLTLLMRTPRTLMAGLILPGALLALQLGRVQHIGQGAAADLLAARVAGLVVLGAMSVAYLTHASSLIVAREDGILRRWRATPLPAWGYFAGRIAAAVLIADVAALILVLVGVAMAGLHLTAAGIVSLLVAATAGSLALAAAGTAITRLIPSGQGANQLLALTYIPLIIFSGGFGGLSGLPHWLNTLMSYLPAQPMIDAVTRALEMGTGQPGLSLPGRDLAVLAAWAVGCLLLSVRFFRWDPTRPRHARAAGAGNPARSVKKLAADRPAARLQRVQQRAGLGGADRELGHADRQPGRVLDPDVLDVDAGPPRRVEQPGQLAGLVTDDDLDHGELARRAAVLAGNPGHPGLADVEQRGDRFRVAVDQHPGRLGQVGGHRGQHLGDGFGVRGQDLGP
jgi:ABC-2 type transport system permease protein